MKGAAEALELYRADGFRRFRNRIDPATDLQATAAVCSEVLAATAAERDEPEQAATLLGHADRLRGGSGVEVPGFQHATVAGAREAAVAVLGSAAFLAAFDRGKQGDEVAPVS